MTDEPKARILLHVTDALLRARKLPVGAARNNLRLRDLHRTSACAHLTGNESPETGSESMR